MRLAPRALFHAGWLVGVGHDEFAGAVHDVLPPAQGAAHDAACLEALALYDDADENR